MTAAADRYRRQAEEAERAAKLAKTPDERAAYLQIADGWRKLLEQEEARRSAGP